LRIGFVVGNKDLIYALQRRQTPFSVNVFAQKFAEVSLDDMEFLNQAKQYAQIERKYLEIEMTKLGNS
jgi:threonine-phosphate decarboxylase